MFTCLLFIFVFYPLILKGFSISEKKKSRFLFSFAVLVCFVVFFLLVILGLHSITSYFKVSLRLFFSFPQRVLCLSPCTTVIQAFQDHMHWGTFLLWENWPLEDVAKFRFCRTHGFFLLFQIWVVMFGLHSKYFIQLFVWVYKAPKHVWLLKFENKKWEMSSIGLF